MAYDWTQDADCQGAWLFAEGSGTSVEDSSSNSNTGTFSADGDPAWSETVPAVSDGYVGGNIDYSASFDGSAYIDFGTGLDNLAPFVWTGWIRPENRYQRRIYASSVNADGSSSIAMQFDTSSGGGSTGKLRFAVWNTSSAEYAGATTDAAVLGSDNVWYHIAAVWDGNVAGSVKIYVGGSEVKDNSGGSGTRRNDSAYYKGLSKTTFSGLMTDVGIFDAVLDSTDINDIMDNGLKQSATATIKRRMLLGVGV
jgi:hypothetical protein